MVQVRPRPYFSWLAAGASGRNPGELAKASSNHDLPGRSPGRVAVRVVRIGTRTPVVIGAGWLITIAAVAVARTEHSTTRSAPHRVIVYLHGLWPWACTAAGVTLAVLALLSLVTAPVLRFSLGRYDISHSDLAALRGFGEDSREAIVFALYFLLLAVMTLFAYWTLYEVMYVTSLSFHGNVIVTPWTWGYFSAVTASTVGFGDITPSNAVAQIAVTTQLVGGPLVLFWLFSVLVSVRTDDAPREIAGTLDPGLATKDEAAVDRATRSPEPRRPAVTYVLPSYNEGPALLRTVKAIRREHRSDYADVIVVDDGSSDGSGEGLLLALGEPSNVSVLRAEHRRGKGWAVREGARLAQGRTVVVLDADAPISTPEVTRCLALLESSVDKECLMGVRDGRLPAQSAPAARRAGTRVLQRILWSDRDRPDRSGSDPFCPLKIVRADSDAMTALLATRALGYLMDLEFRNAVDQRHIPVLDEHVAWQDLRGPARRIVRRYSLQRVLRDLTITDADTLIPPHQDTNPASDSVSSDADVDARRKT